MSAASARIQIDMRGRGTLGSLLKGTEISCPIKRYHVTDILDGSRETLVPLRVIVLQTDLKLDCLDEVAFLLAGCLGKHLFDGAPHA